MNILGVNYFFHDTSACVIKGGRLVSAIEEERLSREKHTTAFPHRAIDAALALAGLEADDVDHVALSVKPTLAWRKKLTYALRHPEGAAELIRNDLGRLQRRQRHLFKWWMNEWPGLRKPRLHFVEHHLSHAAGSFYVSPFDRAAILCLDGSGEWPTSWMGEGHGNSVEVFHQNFFPMSLGSCYEAVTEFCGFRPNYDEGKTMGLAPYGDPSRFVEDVRRIIQMDRQGGLHIDLSLFQYQFGGHTRCGPGFFEVFGSPRRRDQPIEQRHRDAAAAFQQVLEEHALGMCRILHQRTGAKHLVVAGGVALNSVMNGRIVRESDFDDIYVMPAAGDNGTSIGAAAVVYNQVLGRPRGLAHQNPYLGTGYGDHDVEAAFRAANVEMHRSDDIEDTVTDLLVDGKIVGWFQGRCEFGPRALGNRSILANPAIADMKDTINAKVKHREPFRPFAPSVVAEAADEVFDIPMGAPFMLKVSPVRSGFQGDLPAITHVDGSARVQTVDDRNPAYHSLIRRFGEKSGVPVVLNTSLNDNGEPIAESPADALRCFLHTGLDAMAIGDFIACKGENPCAPSS